MKVETYYIIGDQPTTCGNCGARTEYVEALEGPWNTEAIQIHTCLGCGLVFKACHDDEGDENDLEDEEDA